MKKFSGGEEWPYIIGNNRKADWICHVLRRNCLLKHVTEVKIEGRTSGTERQKRRRRQLLNDFKEKRVHCILKEEALDRTLLRTGYGSLYGPAVRPVHIGP
jgi:hypothetical protein